MSEIEDSVVLENCVSESKQKRREKYKEQLKENCERYTVRKRVVSEKKKRGCFFAQIVSLSVVISI